jgi:hypothetical protein
MDDLELRMTRQIHMPYSMGWRRRGDVEHVVAVWMALATSPASYQVLQYSCDFDLSIPQYTLQLRCGTCVTPYVRLVV